MEDWKNRVAKEHAELCNKLHKLDLYLNDNDSIQKIDSGSLMLLETQKTAMKTYASILEIRMSRHAIESVYKS